MSDMATKFYNILWQITTERDKHPSWIQNERSILLSEVNHQRSVRGLDPVTEQDIERGEFVGDPNYGVKLAEHCAKLVTV